MLFLGIYAQAQPCPMRRIASQPPPPPLAKSEVAVIKLMFLIGVGTHSFIHAYINSFIHSLINSYVNLFHSVIHSFFHSFIYSFIHSISELNSLHDTSDFYGSRHWLACGIWGCVARVILLQ